MAKLINFPSFSDDRGRLTVIEKIIGFDIKRVYYIKDVKDKDIIRGGHKHKSTYQALIAVSGSCDIYCFDGNEEKIYNLTKDDECLILEPKDWHNMQNFTKDCILLVLASSYFDKDDYIDEKF